MKSWKVLIVIALVLLTISWVIVTPEKKSFSVLSQRVDNRKSSAITEFWDGAGSFVDMIWQ
jgi:type IV secretory pathway VirB3-like protein